MIFEVMAAEGPNYDQAVGAAQAVATKGFDILPGLHPVAQAIGMLALGLIGLAIVLGLGLILRDRLGAKAGGDPPPSSCPPPGGCPEISRLSSQMGSLTAEVRADREERREHRQDIRESVTRIHDRLDDTVTRDEMGHVLAMSQSAHAAMSSGIAALTHIAESIRSTASAPRRVRSSKRTSP